MNDQMSGSGDLPCPQCGKAPLRSYQGVCEECFLLQPGWRSAGGNRLAKRFDREEGPLALKKARKAS